MPSAHDGGVRTKVRIVKRAISKYNARGPNIYRTTCKAAVTTEMLMAGRLTTPTER